MGLFDVVIDVCDCAMNNIFHVPFPSAVPFPLAYPGSDEHMRLLESVPVPVLNGCDEFRYRKRIFIICEWHLFQFPIFIPVVSFNLPNGYRKNHAVSFFFPVNPDFSSDFSFSDFS